MGYSPRGRKESGRTERLHFSQGNPLPGLPWLAPRDPRRPRPSHHHQQFPGRAFPEAVAQGRCGGRAYL